MPIHLLGTIDKLQKRMDLLKIFHYYGGDFYLYITITKFFPKNHRIVEVFGGSGVISLNHPNAYVWNDKDVMIYRVFRAVMLHPERVVEHVQRYYPKQVDNEYLKQYIAQLDKILLRNTTKHIYDIDPYELAGIFIIRSHFALKGFGNAWVKGNRVTSLKTIVKRIKLISLKLRKLTLLNNDFEEVIKRFDTKNNILFYMDPPWYEYTLGREDDKTYQLGMSMRDWKRFFDLLGEIKNRVFIKHLWSTKFLARLPKERDWYVVKLSVKAQTSKTYTSWMFVMNYKPDISLKQSQNNLLNFLN